MEDEDIVRRITSLVDEEHHLDREHGEGTGLSDEDAERRREVEVQLDQCWDLLRQRRARCNAGQDPADASVRDPSVVESYRQ